MRRILLVAAAACLLAAPLRAADTVVPVKTVAPPRDSERAQRIELARRMDAVVEASRKTLAGLETMIAASTNPSSTQDLERRMAQVKFDTTLDLLRVQSAFARENGRVAQADAIDARIDAILHPRAVQ